MTLRRFLLGAALVVLGAGAAAVDGANVGVQPGVKTYAGTFTEWPVPTPKSPRDPAVAPDGAVWFAVRLAGRIARFDPRHKRFQEWAAPAGMQPSGLVVTRDAKVVFGGGDLAELDPATGAFRQYRCPWKPCTPYTLALGADDSVWFTDRREPGTLGRLDRGSGRITAYRVGEDPYAVAIDQRGAVWVTRMAADRITRLDPASGDVSEIALPKGSQPRRIAVAPDGMVWVSLYGTGRLVSIDPVAVHVMREYALPGGPNAGPYSILSDAAGRIWVSEIQTDTVIMLNPRSETVRLFKLPTRDSGLRSAAIDPDGRFWYVGTVSGRLGVLD